MPRRICPGGHEINTTVQPSEHEFFIVSAIKREALIDKIKALPIELNADEREDAAFRMFSSRVQHLPLVLECPKCGRILIYEDASDSGKLLNSYLPEQSSSSSGGSLRDYDLKHRDL